MQFSIKPNTYIYLTILLFTVPLQWIMSWLTAILFHEFCHWLAVKLCHGTVYSLTVGLGGADMQCSNMSDKCRFFAILCGPVGGLSLILFGRWIPRIALCSVFLSVYNLVPLLPFDGGRALMILVNNERVFCHLQKIFMIIVFLVALLAVYFLHLGILPLLIVVGIWLKNRKIPCKEGVCKVQ